MRSGTTRGAISLRGKHCFKKRSLTVEGPPRVLMRRRERYANGLMFTNSDSRKEDCDDERFWLMFSSVALGSKFVPQFFTSWAHQAQYATYAHAFLLSFFLTVENKRLVNPTPKRRSRVGRAGASSFKANQNLAFPVHVRHLSQLHLTDPSLLR